MNLNEQPREMMYSESVIPDNVDYCLGRRNSFYFHDNEEENVYLHQRCKWEIFWEPPSWDGYNLSDGGEYIDRFAVETIVVRPMMKCWGRGL